MNKSVQNGPCQPENRKHETQECSQNAKGILPHQGQAALSGENLNGEDLENVGIQHNIFDIKQLDENNNRERYASHKPSSLKTLDPHGPVAFSLAIKNSGAILSRPGYESRSAGDFTVKHTHYEVSLTNGRLSMQILKLFLLWVIIYCNNNIVIMWLAMSSTMRYVQIILGIKIVCRIIFCEGRQPAMMSNFKYQKQNCDCDIFDKAICSSDDGLRWRWNEKIWGLWDLDWFLVGTDSCSLLQLAIWLMKRNRIPQDWMAARVQKTMKAMDAIVSVYSMTRLTSWHHAMAGNLKKKSGLMVLSKTGIFT